MEVKNFVCYSSYSIIKIPKIQGGRDLTRYSPNVWLDPNSPDNKVLALLDTKCQDYIGVAEIHRATGIVLNSLSAICSGMFSCGFVERREGKGVSKYRLKPEINVNDKQDLFKRALKAKRRQLGTS